MSIPVQQASQTFRLVDERREETVGGPLSLLVPGSRGGHLLLSFDECGPNRREGHLAMAFSPSNADTWRLLTSTSSPRDRQVPVRHFQLAFVGVPGAALVFFEREGRSNE